MVSCRIGKLEGNNFVSILCKDKGYFEDPGVGHTLRNYSDTDIHKLIDNGNIQALTPNVNEVKRLGKRPYVMNLNEAIQKIKENEKEKVEFIYLYNPGMPKSWYFIDIYGDRECFF